MKTKEIKQYLKNGRYIVFDGKLVIPLNKENVFRTFRNLIRHKFFASVRIIRVAGKEKENQPTGNRMIYRNWDGQILIFDDVGKWFYRKYTNVSQFASIKDGHAALEKSYRINKVYFEERYTTKEKLLPGITLRKTEFTTQNEIFEDIVERFRIALIENQSQQTTPQINSDDFFLKFSATHYPEDMKTYILSEKESITNLLTCLQWTWNHCDLSPDNVLVDNHEYHLIDSEWCDGMPVPYDIINLILTLDTMAKNKTPINNYFNGKYDTLLKASLKKEEIADLDRIGTYLIMLVLKGILAWDAKRKQNDKLLLKRRWETVKNRII